MSATDPGEGLPLWVPKQLTSYPTRINWLKNLAEQPPHSPTTAWTLLPEFVAQRDFRAQVQHRRANKRKLFKQKQSEKVKCARVEAKAKPMTKAPRSTCWFDDNSAMRPKKTWMMEMIDVISSLVSSIAKLSPSNLTFS